MDDYLDPALEYQNPYQDESEQLYQYYLRNATKDYAGIDPNLGLTIPDWAYERALSGVVGDRVPKYGIDPGVAIPDYKTDPEGYMNVVSKNTRMMKPENKSPALANVDHGLQSQKDWSKLGPLVGMRPPVYQLLKLLAQRTPRRTGVPARLDAFGRSRVGQRLLQSDDAHPFTQASPPTWEQLMWGLRPFWGRN